MPQSIANQASGAGEKRCRDSSTAIMLDTTVESSVNQAPKRRSRVVGQSEYSDFVFTSLTDAIREWNETRDSKAQNELSFNILATVRKWSNPKESKGVISSIYMCTENWHVVWRIRYTCRGNVAVEWVRLHHSCFFFLWPQKMPQSTCCWRQGSSDWYSITNVERRSAAYWKKYSIWALLCFHVFNRCDWSLETC